MQDHQMEAETPQNVLSDCEIELSVFYSQKAYSEMIRMVRYWDEDDQRKFFTSPMPSTYPLFKSPNYIKQMAGRAVPQMVQATSENQKVLGTTENAVKIQVYTAIVTYCLVAIMQLDRSTYEEVLQILGISLTDKTPLRDLFCKTKFNNIKDHSGLDEPNLFDNFNF